MVQEYENLILTLSILAPLALIPIYYLRFGIRNQYKHPNLSLILNPLIFISGIVIICSFLYIIFQYDTTMPYLQADNKRMILFSIMYWFIGVLVLFHFIFFEYHMYLKNTLSYYKLKNTQTWGEVNLSQYSPIVYYFLSKNKDIAFSKLKYLEEVCMFSIDQYKVLAMNKERSPFDQMFYTYDDVINNLEESLINIRSHPRYGLNKEIIIFLK